MAKLPHPPPPLKDDDFEAPTVKRSLPAELRGDGEPGVHATAYVTTKLRKAEIEALLSKEHQGSGMRRAISDEDIERFERRETRETLPAPPSTSVDSAEAEAEEEEEPRTTPRPVGFAKPAPLPEGIADLDADDEP